MPDYRTRLQRKVTRAGPTDWGRVYIAIAMLFIVLAVAFPFCAP